MLITLTHCHPESTYILCDRTTECVTSHFEDGFVREAPLCWRCLAKATKFRSQQEAKPPAKPNCPRTQ